MKQKIIILATVICWSSQLMAQETQLVLEGSIKLGTNTESNPANGTIRWSGTDLEVWKNGGWISLTTGTQTPADNLIDQDGNVYRTVTIGNRVWMAENLRTSTYRDGSSIDLVTGDPNWNSQTTGAFCWYDDDTGYENVYGKLYNWFAVEDPRGLCPTGWDVPSRIEWANMTATIGGSSIAGGKLKEVGLLHWDSPNTGASDEYNFTSLPGGFRSTSSIQEGRIAFYWLRNPSGSSAYYQSMVFNNVVTTESTAGKAGGMSVRCIKND